MTRHPGAPVHVTHRMADKIESTEGDANTAVGYEAGGEITSGSGNVNIGHAAGDSLTTGSNNVIIGRNAATNQTTATNNTIVGEGAGATLIDASSCILIGREANVSASGRSELVIGNTVVGKGDNTGLIYPPGGGGIYNGGNTSTWNQTSDRRIKKNIEDNNTGLDAINKIRVRNFEYRTEDEITEVPSHAAIDKEGIQLGVIAQEIEEILPDVVTEESTGVKTVNPDNITWYLVNAVKELSTQVDELKAEIQTLKGE